MVSPGDRLVPIPHSALRIPQFFLLVTLITSQSLSAGEFNDVLSIGDAAPVWMELPGTDGKTHSLSDLKDRKIVVVVFTCASCPTAVDYEKRIGDLAARFADQSVAVVPICVNQVKQDRLEALTERVKKQQLGFHVLYDESQQIAKDFGAVFTPEFFVLNQDRKVVYMGAFDDSSNPANVKERWVEQAITATLAGEKPRTAETIARGCRVRYARERK
jgi:peroxiredoxin